MPCCTLDLTFFHTGHLERLCFVNKEGRREEGRRKTQWMLAVLFCWSA